MSKYLDIKVGKKLKVFRYKEGTNRNNEKWALFSFTPSEKDDKGNYIYGQEYTISIRNISEINYVLHDGDFVEIVAINSVTANDSTYTSKQTKQTINKRVIVVSVDISLVGNDNPFDNNYNQQPNANNNGNNNNQYPPVFENTDIDIPDF